MVAPSEVGAYWTPRAERLTAITDELARLAFALDGREDLAALRLDVRIARDAAAAAARRARELAGSEP